MNIVSSDYTTLNHWYALNAVMTYQSVGDETTFYNGDRIIYAHKSINRLIELFNEEVCVSSRVLHQLADAETVAFLEKNEIILETTVAHKLKNDTGDKRFGIIGFPLATGKGECRQNPARGMFHTRAVFKMILKNQHVLNAIADYGNISYCGAIHNGAITDFKKQITSMLERKLLPVTFGGDHALTFFVMESILGYAGANKVALIHIDAHSDADEAVTNNESRLNHANYLSLLVGGHDVPVYLIGVRDGHVFTSDQVMHIDNKTACSVHLLDHLPENYSYYLSIDIDVIDPCFAPDVNYPSSLGLFPRELNEMLILIAGNRKIAAVDIVEVCNSNSAYNSTASIASKLVLNTLTTIYERGIN